MSFSPDGALLETDYWTCEGGASSGRAWCSVQGGRWHLLAPDPPLRVRTVWAFPMMRKSEPGRWWWSIWLDKRRTYDLPADSFVGTMPELPPPGYQGHGTLICHTPYLPHLGRMRWGFGHDTFGGHVGESWVKNIAIVRLTRPGQMGGD